MAREFTAYVVLRDPKTLEAKSFKPGDAVPDWATVGDHVASNGVSRERQTVREGDAPNDATETSEDATVTLVTPQHEQEAAGDDEIPPYEEWSKTDLKAEAKGRELTGYSNATVDELVAMLQADDAENAE